MVLSRSKDFKTGLLGMLSDLYRVHDPLVLGRSLAGMGVRGDITNSKYAELH